MSIDPWEFYRVLRESSLRRDEPTVGELNEMAFCLYQLHRPVPRTLFDSEATVGYDEVCREDRQGWPCSTYEILTGERK